MVYFKRLVGLACLLLLSEIMLVACHFTVSRHKNPIFTDPTGIYLQLDSILPGGKVVFQGEETKSSDQSPHSTLTISIFIANSITPGQQRAEIADRIAKKVWKGLLRPGQFDDYTIAFVSKEKNGVVTNTVSESYVVHPSSFK